MCIVGVLENMGFWAFFCIFHYILQHGYKPPQKFIETGDVFSGEYYQKIFEYSNSYDFWLADDLTKIFELLVQ